MSERPDVAIWDTGATGYPAAPFHPGEAYAEYPFGEAVGPANPVYAGMRDLLASLQLGAGSPGTPEWNPLAQMVLPGNTVIIKPNFVVSEHPKGQPGIEAAVVNGAVLRPLVDYVLVALQGRGRIIIADSPIKEVDFDRIVQLSGIGAVLDFCRPRMPAGVSLELLDFRDAQVRRNDAGFMEEWSPLPGDPAGYTPVDLGDRSMFHEIAPNHHRLRSTAVYYEDVMGQFHNPQHNVYSLPNTLLNADVVISVAKLKTHRKGGITLTLKNAVGITNEKRGLPHHRVGSPSEGGDAVADNARMDAKLEDAFRDFMLSRPAGKVGLKLLGGPLRLLAGHVVKPIFRRLSPGRPAVTEGDWYGNDTVWRMALDLNHALAFAATDGSLRDTPQRRWLGIIDGVVAGEGEGPLLPDPKVCGVLVAGTHPVLTDVAATRLMGYDWTYVPMLREGSDRTWPLRPPVAPGQMTVASNRPAWQHLLQTDDLPFRFEPTAGWRGHIELRRAPNAPTRAPGPKS